MDSRGDSVSKGENVSEGGSNPDVEQLVKGFSETKLGPSQDDGGELEVFSKSNKNKPGNTFDDSDEDPVVVWPPMVIIMNTGLDKDDNHKWRMDNPELLKCFRKEYACIRALNSYGPQGHCGMSVLIFGRSATGYYNAARLHEDLAQKGLDRNAWERWSSSSSWVSGGVRQLYGFLATKKDLEAFNQHSGVSTRLEYEMKSMEEIEVLFGKTQLPDDLISKILQKVPLMSAAKCSALSSGWAALCGRDTALTSWTQAFANPRIIFTSFIDDTANHRGYSRWFHSVLQTVPPQSWDENQVNLPRFESSKFPYICPPVHGTMICHGVRGRSAICNPTWGSYNLLPRLSDGLMKDHTTRFYLGYDNHMEIFKILCVIYYPQRDLEYLVLSLVDENSSWRKLDGIKCLSADPKDNPPAGYSGLFINGKIYFEAGVSTVMCFDVRRETFSMTEVPLDVAGCYFGLMKVNKKLALVIGVEGDLSFWTFEEERWSKLPYLIPALHNYRCIGTIETDKFIFTSKCVPLRIYYYDARRRLGERIPIDYSDNHQAPPVSVTAFLDYIECPNSNLYKQ